MHETLKNDLHTDRQTYPKTGSGGWLGAVKLSVVGYFSALRTWTLCRYVVGMCNCCHEMTLSIARSHFFFSYGLFDHLSFLQVSFKSRISPGRQ